MQIEPSAAAFGARYAAGEPQVAWTTLVADLETPVSVFLKVTKNASPMSFLANGKQMVSIAAGDLIVTFGLD